MITQNLYSVEFYGEKTKWRDSPYSRNQEAIQQSRKGDKKEIDGNSFA